MNFGSARSTTAKQEERSNNQTKAALGSKSGSQFQRMLQRGRLTEEDLESFHLNILKSHKKKNYKVLAISAIFLICLVILVYYLIR